MGVGCPGVPSSRRRVVGGHEGGGVAVASRCGRGGRRDAVGFSGRHAGT